MDNKFHQYYQMKKITILSILIVVISVNCNAQSTQFNLDFEKIEKNRPIDWKVFGSENYVVSIDTTISQNGNYSAVIEYSGGSTNFKAWAYHIPAKYQGTEIRLTGYIKTENVSAGYAGLWMRIDPRVAFDNMNNRGVIGTTDWEKYEIELELNPSNAKQIVVGGLLVGKGKMWIDNLQITIDGEPLEKTSTKKSSLTDKDNEFDKGSNVSFPELDNQLTINLELLGKIWGFLKYHHPAIAKGNYNWDYELFRILPKYINQEDSLNRDMILLDWIDDLGKIKECKTCKETPEDAFLKPDFNWINNSNISSELKQKLHYIYKNRHQGEQYYIAMAPNVGNPEFINENPYADMPYPDEGFRLLTLYKYWNMIHYFFPSKYLMNKNWTVVLKEYLPNFINAKNELEYELAVIQLIGDVQDTHANIWGGNNAIQEWRGKFYAPIHVRFIENKLVITDYYNPELKDDVGLQVGDVITKINGTSIEDIIKEKLPYYPASNYPTQLRDISQDILRSNSRTIQLSYIRDKSEITTELQLFSKKALNVYQWYPRNDFSKCYKLLDGNIGYITLKNIKKEDIEDIKKQFINTKGIIVDIRNYPSTFVVFTLGSYFVDTPTPFVKFTTGNTDNPGEFVFTKAIEIPNDLTSYNGKVIVIVNEFTLSQAEYTTMALRAGNNTTVIGSTTAGADGNVSPIYLPGGLRTLISGIGVYYPDGTQTQRVGIVPDIEVKPSVDGIKAGRDELLEKAIQLINE